MSPGICHTRAVTLSVVLPDAPRKTSRGKADDGAERIVQSVHPQILTAADARNRRRATTHRLHIQKAPRICTGLYAREQQAGREREHQAQRTADHIFFGHGEPDADGRPAGPQTANAASPHPARKTTTERALVESLRMKKAYRIFPAYSKNSRPARAVERVHLAQPPDFRAGACRNQAGVHQRRRQQHRHRDFGHVPDGAALEIEHDGTDQGTDHDHGVRR